MCSERGGFLYWATVGYSKYFLQVADKTEGSWMTLMIKPSLTKWNEKIHTLQWSDFISSNCRMLELVINEVPFGLKDPMISQEFPKL